MSKTNRKRMRITAAAAAGAIAVAGGTLAASWAGIAQAAPAQPAMQQQPAYDFATLNNANDLTFNQLLGINNHGVIAGKKHERCVEQLFGGNAAPFGGEVLGRATGVFVEADDLQQGVALVAASGGMLADLADAFCGLVG